MPIILPFKVLNRALCYLWGEGDWKLRPLHQQIIDQLLAHLDIKLKGQIQAQLEQRYFMQFMSDGRINAFFFNELPHHLRISDPAFQNCLFKIEIFVDGGKHDAQIWFSNGQIFEVQFKKRYKFFEGKEIRMGSVTLGKPKDTFTTVIDRAAHGCETDDNP